MPANRSKTGQFTPGQSGNPNGRPKMPEDMRQMLRDAGPELVRKLLEYTEHSNPKVAMWAITEALNRGYGKPVQMQDVALDVSGGLDVDAHIRRVAMEMVDLDRRGNGGKTEA